ncbi:MAG: hypothetical protein RLY20_1508 [Verrucomicrobiota bacterium]
MSLTSRLLTTSIRRGYLEGTVTVASKNYPCRHSPIQSQAKLSDGGMTLEAVVTVIILAEHVGTATFRSGQNASLKAADGKTYRLRLQSSEANGVAEFTQLIFVHADQGA